MHATRSSSGTNQSKSVLVSKKTKTRTRGKKKRQLPVLYASRKQFQRSNQKKSFHKENHKNAEVVPFLYSKTPIEEKNTHLLPIPPPPD